MSVAMTRDIEVRVMPRYHPEHSDTASERWFFSYTVRITNRGEHTVQLLTRHWFITNAEGRTEEVRGAGVVGEQPTLAPGESFTYTSFCPLDTSLGAMHGTYGFVTDGGEHFDATIAPFTLADPDELN